MSQLKTMLFIHTAFCVGIFIFGVVSVIVTADSAYFDATFQNPDPIQFIAPFVAIFGIIIGGIMFNKVLGNTAQGELGTNSKLVKYQTAFIIKCAFLETGALINILVVIATSNVLFLGFAIASLIALWLSRPTRDKVTYTLNLQDSDFR
jgi:hypothetical protein